MCKASLYQHENGEFVIWTDTTHCNYCIGTWKGAQDFMLTCVKIVCVESTKATWRRCEICSFRFDISWWMACEVHKLNAVQYGDTAQPWYIICGRLARTELQYCPLTVPASCNKQTAAFALHETPSRACCSSTRCIVTWPLPHKLCSNFYFRHLASALYPNRQDLHDLLSWYYGCPLYRVPQQCTCQRIFIE